jgi:molybdopterin-guanine dinucleotide biosynthesis protein A
MSEFAAVVLAGGAARRMGGAAKPAVRVGGTPLLTRVLEAAERARPRIVVGPLELTPLLRSGVSLTIEEMPGTGPVAGLAAGVHLLTDTVHDVAVLGSDLPFVTADVLDRLRAELSGSVEVAVLVDNSGRPQWMCSVWHRKALVSRLERLGDLAGRSMRELVDGAQVQYLTIQVPAGPPPWFDCDTDEDVRQAEEWADGNTG